MGTLAISFVSSFVSVLFWREKSRGLLIPESSGAHTFHCKRLHTYTRNHEEH